MGRFDLLVLCLPPFIICVALAMLGTQNSAPIFGAVATVVIFGLALPWTAKPHRGKRAAPDLPPAVSMRDLASVRIALTADTRDAIANVVRAQGSNTERVRHVVEALLREKDAWIYTSLESTPLRPSEHIDKARARLIDDAAARFVTRPSSDDGVPFRSPAAASGVFVISLVFTSSHEIRSHQDDSHAATKALLLHLLDLAPLVECFDVFMGDVMSIDELPKRDPAMQGIA